MMMPPVVEVADPAVGKAPRGLCRKPLREEEILALMDSAVTAGVLE